MTSIGIVGLDTSHPGTFAPLLVDRGVEIAGVWDGGNVRDRAFVEEFCADFGATTYDDPAAMVDAVDGAMVLNVDWDRHRELAEPFLAAGIPTLIDKPIAGTQADIQAIAEVAGSTPVFGGSSVPFHPALRGVPRGVSGRTLVCTGHFGGYDTPIYYGAHTVDIARRLADADWHAVTPIDGPGRAVNITFANESHAVLRLDGPQDDPVFGVLDASDAVRPTMVRTRSPDGARTHASYLEAFLAVIAGDRDETARILDGGSLSLAVLAALDHGARIERDDDVLDAFHADGAAFLESYR